MPFLSIFTAVWSNQWTRLAVIAAAAFGFGFFKGFEAVPRVDVAAIQRNAEAARDAAWQTRLADVQRQSEEAVAVALQAGAAEPPTPAVPAERVQLCAKSATCRDRRR